jgi:Fe-S cluster biogenesis protein NfuA
MTQTKPEQAQIEARIQQVLAEVIAPRLAEHGGGIDFKSFENGVVQVHFRGACAGCPSAMQTIEELVLVELAAAVPEVAEVAIAQNISEDMLDLARQILSKSKE